MKILAIPLIPILANWYIYGENFRITGTVVCGSAVMLLAAWAIAWWRYDGPGIKDVIIGGWFTLGRFGIAMGEATGAFFEQFGASWRRMKR